MANRWISRSGARRLGLVAGPAAALAVYFALPATFHDVAAGATAELGHAGRATLAILVWMALWWLTEAVEVAVTALLPLALFPLLGAASPTAAAAPYASPVIYLFLGGFVMALAMQRQGLDRRVALLTLRLVGTRPRDMVGGMMLATAALSAVVSNTATAAMMLPIALSVIDLVVRRDSGVPAGDVGGLARGEGRHFALSLMLGIAYGASIGGITTIIGTPPNLFLVGFVRDSLGTEISFVAWLGVGVPLAAILLPLAWWLLTAWVYPTRVTRIEGGRALLAGLYRDLGPVKPAERRVLAVFTAAALAWVTRPLLVGLELAGVRPLAGLTDSGIAVLAALALFVLPAGGGAGGRVIDWATARRLPWGVLILFGGGLSLAQAVEANRVADFLGGQAAVFAGAPGWLLVLVVTAAIVFLTELTSNTATTATLVPILASLAPALGLEPFRLIVPAAVAASCAFMMPVATPPNAIVFGSGHVTIPQMCRAGLWLNLLAIALISSLGSVLAGWLAG